MVFESAHTTIRKILGHGPYNEIEYQYETLMDKVKLLTPELLDEINQLVVNAGHVLIKKGGRRSAAWALRLLCR